MLLVWTAGGTAGLVPFSGDSRGCASAERSGDPMSMLSGMKKKSASQSGTVSYILPMCKVLLYRKYNYMRCSTGQTRRLAHSARLTGPPVTCTHT